MTMLIELSYDEISEFWLCEDMWGKKLFPGRTSENLYYDGSKSSGGIDKRQRDVRWSKPYFYGARVNGKIVGVNSFYRSTETSCRSRGLYVVPDYRGVGIGAFLLQYAIEQNTDKGFDYIWSMPRSSAVWTYQQAGFSITPTGAPFEEVRGLGSLLHPVKFARYDY